MPWRCPACHEPISHSAAEEIPRPGVRYRCHVCRIELVVDPIESRLTVAPFPVDSTDDVVPRRPRKKTSNG